MATKKSSKKAAKKTAKKSAKKAAKKTAKKSAKKSSKKRASTARSKSTDTLAGSVFEDRFPAEPFASQDTGSDVSAYDSPSPFSVEEKESSSRTGLGIAAAILVLIVGIFLFKDSFLGDGENTGADPRQSEITADGQQQPGEAPANEQGEQEDQAENQDQTAEQQGEQEDQAAQQEEQQPADNQASETREYAIKPGDTYGKIATTELGDRNRWKEIQKLNPDVNAGALKVGQKIKLPAK
ncbi:MAG: hypothetical protein CMN76_07400 [Spirochaetaceae bacterium]|nr:hypothetical protein [Spirochaetaceae bacterium]